MPCAHSTINERTCGNDFIFNDIHDFREHFRERILIMIGRTISHYTILEKLGEGGMGIVYKAMDNQLERVVALKFLPPTIATNADTVARFRQEAKAAAALNHPNIATIHAIEEADGHMFIVMEFVEGLDLREHIGKKTMSIDETLRIAAQIAAGLQTAHEKEIVHRDIKSSNIMLTESGQVKIMDFGLAKVRGSALETRERTTVGTAAYMSPEQARGEEVDHRTDIWSFGVVLYEMLTGRLPFASDYEQAAMYSILNEDPVIPSHLPDHLQQVLERSLAKQPGDRYQTVHELAAGLGTERNESAAPGRRALPSKHLVIAGMAIVLIVAAISLLFNPFRKAEEKKIIKAIAVLPFVDLSPQGDQEYFSDGLSEELLNVLANNPNLRVTSRTSSFSFKKSSTDIKTIASKLGVKYILEGSVRKSGNILRITAQLIDAETDAHLWSKIYDGAMENVFALQDSISGSVSDALEVTLLGEQKEPRKRTTVADAYNAYLLGKHFYALRGRDNWEKSAVYYEQAVSIDPQYAPAWVGLSKVHSSQADYGYQPVDESFRKARTEVERALALDPNLAGAYSQLGWIKRGYDWDWAGADSAYRRALELEPGDASIITNAAVLSATMGRFAEAMKLTRHSIELNPLSIARYNNLGLIALKAGQLDEAEAAFKKTIELNPRYPGAHMQVGLVYLKKGDFNSALAAMMAEGEHDWQLYGLALAYHALGKQKEADEKLAAFIAEFQDDAAYQIAQIYSYRGESDNAFAWLERAYAQRDGGCSEIKGDPLLEKIEGDPRYAAFLRKMKLPV